VPSSAAAVALAAGRAAHHIAMTPPIATIPRATHEIRLGLAHPPADRRRRNKGKRREIQMKRMTGFALMLITVLTPLSAYASRTNEVQVPYWDRPDPPSQPVP